MDLEKTRTKQGEFMSKRFYSQALPIELKGQMLMGHAILTAWGTGSQRQGQIRRSLEHQELALKARGYRRPVERNVLLVFQLLKIHPEVSGWLSQLSI